MDYYLNQNKYILFSGSLIGLLTYSHKGYQGLEVFGMSVWLYLFLITVVISFIHIYLRDYTASRFSMKLTVVILIFHLLRLGYDFIFSSGIEHEYVLVEIALNVFITLGAAFLGAFMVTMIKGEE